MAATREKQKEGPEDIDFEGLSLVNYLFVETQLPWPRQAGFTAVPPALTPRRDFYDLCAHMSSPNLALPPFRMWGAFQSSPHPECAGAGSRWLTRANYMHFFPTLNSVTS